MPSTVSQVDIANRALSKLGERRIDSLAEEGNAPETLNDMFGIVRDSELEAHPWAFSKTRVQLTDDPTTPVFGYSYRYRKPSDFVRLIQVGDTPVLWAAAGIQYSYFPASEAGAPAYEIEGDFILTDYGAPLDVIYGRRETDTTLYPPTFVEAFATRLAFEACQKITGEAALRDRLASDYVDTIRLARRTNAIVRPPRQLPPPSWITSRLR